MMPPDTATPTPAPDADEMIPMIEFVRRSEIARITRIVLQSRLRHFMPATAGDGLPADEQAVPLGNRWNPKR